MKVTWLSPWATSPATVFLSKYRDPLARQNLSRQSPKNDDDVNVELRKQMKKEIIDGDSDDDQLRVRDGEGGVNEGGAEEPDPEGGHCKGGHRGEEGHRHREIYVSW